MAVQVHHLIAACNVLADAQAGQITDRSIILAKIRSEARTNCAAELFHRAVALNATLGSDGVAQLLGMADGDLIPEMCSMLLPGRRCSEKDARSRAAMFPAGSTKMALSPPCVPSGIDIQAAVGLSTSHGSPGARSRQVLHHFASA